MPSADRAENNDIREILTEIRDKVNEVAVEQRYVRQDQERHSARIADLHVQINGGPEPEKGLVYQMARIREDAEKQRERTTFWVRAFGTGMLGTMITWMLAAFSTKQGH